MQAARAHLCACAGGSVGLHGYFLVQPPGGLESVGPLHLFQGGGHELNLQWGFPGLGYGVLEVQADGQVFGRLEGLDYRPCDFRIEGNRLREGPRGGTGPFVVKEFLGDGNSAPPVLAALIAYSLLGDFHFGGVYFVHNIVCSKPGSGPTLQHIIYIYNLVNSHGSRFSP